MSWIPGGLLQTNIAGCAVFAAISGSSVVTAASIGRVALPELAKKELQPAPVCGILSRWRLCSGILLPPSIAMIVYGTFTENFGGEAVHGRCQCRAFCWLAMFMQLHRRPRLDETGNSSRRTQVRDR